MMGHAIILNAYDYAHAWAKWGSGFNGFATGVTNELQMKVLGGLAPALKIWGD